MSGIPHDDDAWMETLSACADGECSADEMRVVDAHLAECEPCRTWLAQTSADRDVYIGAVTQAVDGVDLRAAVQARLRPLRPPGRQYAPWRRALEWGVAGTVICVLIAIFFPVFAMSREKARQSSCMSNVKQIMLGALMFAKDHNDRLPDAYRWQEQVAPYVRNASVFECPGDERGRWRDAEAVPYVMNPLVGGKRLDDFEHPEDVIVIFDADESGNPAPRHDGGTNCGFLDGHAKWIQGVPPGLSGGTSFAPPTRNYGLADQLKVAYQGTTELFVRSIHQASLAAEQAVTAHGGFVLRSTLEAVEEPYKAQVVCKVPAEEVAGTLNDLAALGWVARRDVVGDDLTQSYVDASRALRAARKREDRASAATRQPGNVRSPADANQTLATAEQSADQTESKLFDIEAATTLATIAATLTQREPEVHVERIPGTWSAATYALKSTLVVLAQVAIWLLLFSWVWAPAAILIRRRSRRRMA